MVPIWWRDKEDLVKKLQQLDWITRNCRCWSRPGEGSQPEIPPVHSINAYIPEMVYRLWKDMEYQRICQYSPNLYCKILKIRIVFYKYFYILSWMMLAFLCLGSQYSICSFGKLMKYKGLSAKCNYNFLPLQWNLSSNFSLFFFPHNLGHLTYGQFATFFIPSVLHSCSMYNISKYWSDIIFSEKNMILFELKEV